MTSCVSITSGAQDIIRNGTAQTVRMAIIFVFIIIILFRFSFISVDLLGDITHSRGHLH